MRWIFSHTPPVLSFPGLDCRESPGTEATESRGNGYLVPRTVHTDHRPFAMRTRFYAATSVALTGENSASTLSFKIGGDPRQKRLTRAAETIGGGAVQVVENGNQSGSFVLGGILNASQLGSRSFFFNIIIFFS